MDGSSGGLESVRLDRADHASSRTTVGTNGDRQIVSIAAVSSVEVALAQQQVLADQLTSASSAGSLLVWRSERALLVSRTESRLPHFGDAIAGMRATGWPVVLRKSGGLACPVAPGTVQMSMIDPILPSTTINGKYAVLAELLQAALRRYEVRVNSGVGGGAYCPGTYDLAVGDRKIAGMSQHWFRNRCGIRCVVIAASVNIEEAPDEVACVVNQFYRYAGSALHCDADALTNLQLCGGASSVCGPDFAAAVIDQLTSSMSGMATSAQSHP
jgi:octanoyl-[GcvH]:protein N-octanoyltransferase